LAAVSDETGTGVTVFGTGPTLSNAFFTGTTVIGSGDATATIGAGVLRGPAAFGTDLAGVNTTVRPSAGTGTGSIGVLVLNGIATKQVTGTTTHGNGLNYLTIGATQASHPGVQGFVTSAPAQTINDEVTAQSGTAALASMHSFLGKTMTARQTSVTTTDATTVYINPPIASTNMTFTNTYGLINTGATRLDGVVRLPGIASGSGATTGTVCWTTTTGNLTVNATVACLASTRRIKEHIHTLDEGLETIMALRPVRYHLKAAWNPTGEGEQLGLIAEEVIAVEPRLATVDETGEPSAVRYQQLTAVLVKAIQEQQAQIERLQARLEALERR
jgi:hypothetical protein